VSSWRSPHSGASYPAGWRIELPGERSRLWLRPLVADQELITNKSTGVAYWEGACRVAGTFHGKSVGGFGYTELTGY
jgi:predicted secreted hydrolase